MAGACWFHFDLIPRDPSVRRFDICKETLPRADAILCRATLNHLDSIRVEMTLDRFKTSGTPYLFATQFDEQWKEHPGFTGLDLRSYLGTPLETTEDGGARGCQLALWKI